MKREILDELGIILLKRGFVVKVLSSSCFDVVARKDSLILLIKVLKDVNAVSREYAEEMQRIGSYFKASSIIIAECAGAGLQDDVVYLRFGIHTLTLSTFVSCLESSSPILKSSQAGLTAHIRGERLRNAREEIGYSINALAKKIGVSKQMVLRYEHGSSEVTLSKAERIYSLFGRRVFDAVDVFSVAENLEEKAHSPITKKYSELGFNATETRKVPFDIIAKMDKELILTEVGDRTSSEFVPLSNLIEADRLIIFKNKKPKKGPAMTKEAFLDFESARELVKFLKEYR